MPSVLILKKLVRFSRLFSTGKDVSDFIVLVDAQAMEGLPIGPKPMREVRIQANSSIYVRTLASTLKTSQGSLFSGPTRQHDSQCLARISHQSADFLLVL